MDPQISGPEGLRLTSPNLISFYLKDRNSGDTEVSDVPWSGVGVRVVEKDSTSEVSYIRKSTR